MLYLFDKLMDRYADRKTGMYRVQPNSEKKKFLKKQSERSRKITAARNVTNMKKKKRIITFVWSNCPALLVNVHYRY